MYQLIVIKKYKTSKKKIESLGFFDNKKLVEDIIETIKPDFSSIEYFSNGYRMKGSNCCIDYIITPVKLKLE